MIIQRIINFKDCYYLSIEQVSFELIGQFDVVHHYQWGGQDEQEN